MKIAIDKGHCLYGFDTSADGTSVGGFKESEYDRILGDKIINLLRANGQEVVDVTVDNGNQFSNMYGSLSARTSKANANNVDLYVAIHFNAGGGQGTEVYYATGDTSGDICNRIQKNLVALGFKNRGVKNEDFYVLVNSNSPALLMEICFCDSVSDKQLYDSLGVDKIAKAIVEGIVGSYKYPDIAKSGYKDDPYVHYVNYGKKEGRLPIPPIPKEYKEADYLELNPDIAKVVAEGKFSSGIDHYIQYGFKENRKVSKSI